MHTNQCSTRCIRVVYEGRGLARGGVEGSRGGGRKFEVGELRALVDKKRFAGIQYLGGVLQ